MAEVEKKCLGSQHYNVTQPRHFAQIFDQVFLHDSGQEVWNHPHALTVMSLVPHTKTKHQYDISVTLRAERTSRMECFVYPRFMELQKFSLSPSLSQILRITNDVYVQFNLQSHGKLQLKAGRNLRDHLVQLLHFIDEESRTQKEQDICTDGIAQIQ